MDDATAVSNRLEAPRKGSVVECKCRSGYALYCGANPLMTSRLTASWSRRKIKALMKRQSRLILDSRIFTCGELAGLARHIWPTRSHDVRLNWARPSWSQRRPAFLAVFVCGSRTKSRGSSIG